MRRPRVWVAAALVAASVCSNAEGAMQRRRTAPRRSSASAPAREMTLPERLAAVARRMPVRARSQVAVAVAPVGRPPIFSLNADADLVLASTTKLFTTAAALDRLGPDYEFRTTLLQDGELRPDGTLAGHLVVHGGGDPAISG